MISIQGMTATIIFTGFSVFSILGFMFILKRTCHRDDFIWLLFLYSFIMIVVGIGLYFIMMNIGFIPPMKWSFDAVNATGVS